MHLVASVYLLIKDGNFETHADLKELPGGSCIAMVIAKLVFGCVGLAPHSDPDLCTNPVPHVGPDRRPTVRSHV